MEVNPKIGLRCCSDANPWYDRTILRKYLERESGCVFSLAESNVTYDIVYVLCGCDSKCCNVSDLNAQTIVIVDHWPDEAWINSYVHNLQS